MLLFSNLENILLTSKRVAAKQLAHDISRTEF
jgi:hypothetical protein